MEALLLSAAIFLCVGSFSLVIWTIRQFMEDLRGEFEYYDLEANVIELKLLNASLEADLELWKIACENEHKGKNDAIKNCTNCSSTDNIDCTC